MPDNSNDEVDDVECDGDVGIEGFGLCGLLQALLLTATSLRGESGEK